MSPSVAFTNYRLAFIRGGRELAYILVRKIRFASETHRIFDVFSNCHVLLLLSCIYKALWATFTQEKAPSLAHTLGTSEVVLRGVAASLFFHLYMSTAFPSGSVLSHPLPPENLLAIDARD